MAWACAACRLRSAAEALPVGPALVSAPVPPPSGATSAPPRTSELTAGMPPIAPVLGDPRFGEVRDHLDAGDAASAARAMDRLRLALPAPSPDASVLEDYVAGRLHLLAGDDTEAAAAFDRATSAPQNGNRAGPLRDYAHLREAEALLHVGHYDDALVHLRALADDFSARDEATLTLADAFAGKGDRAAAVPLWRGLLAAHPRGVRWVDVAFQLSSALLDGVAGPAESQATEALDLSTRLQVEAPNLAEKLDVSELRNRAARALKKNAAPLLTAEERARQAQAWLEASLPKRAKEVAESVLRDVSPGSREHAAAACKAASILAQATPHGKSQEAADAWGIAIARCEGDELQATALYQGGKASASAKRRTEALSRFDEVEKQFPKHRLADDARLRAAAVVQDGGDESHALSLLASLPDVYPDGDMRSEALFRLALSKLENRDYVAAKDTFDRAIASAPDAIGQAAAGRAEYFRARVSELSGDAFDAKTRYAALVVGQPLSYYMLLAYARLRAEDDALARDTLESSIAHEPQGAFLTREHPEFATAAFQRFIRLLEVGEVDAARREAGALGYALDGADPELMWTVAWLYDRAGAPELGHSFARSRLVDYRMHWPVGRWRLAWEVAYPRPWDGVVLRESESNGIPAPLTWAIMREESAFNPEAKSPVGALGLMQLMGPTARLVAQSTALPYDDAALRRPDVSIALGARLLGSLRVAFPTHPALAIAAYNSGKAPVRRWLDGATDLDLFVEHITYEETRAYVKRVLASEAAYAYLYAPGALDDLLEPFPRR